MVDILTPPSSYFNPSGIEYRAAYTVYKIIYIYSYLVTELSSKVLGGLLYRLRRLCRVRGGGVIGC